MSEESEFHRKFRRSKEFAKDPPGWVHKLIDYQFKKTLSDVYAYAYREGFNRAVKIKAKEEIGV